MTESHRCACQAGQPAAGDDSWVADALSRRVFLVRCGAVVASVTLAACALPGIPTAPNNVSLTLSLTDYPTLATVGGVAYVSAGNSPLAVVRTGSDTFVALSRICPHYGGQINSYASGFRCTVHGAQFDETGHWIGGQPTGNMRSYPTAYNASTGVLTIG